ncbi:MAG: hypothetical protein RIE56_11225, partial [Amphiplicatus sp.]
MRADLILFGAGGAGMLLGAVLFIAPSPSLAPSTPPMMISERAPASLDAQDAARLTALFDLSRLPAPVAALAREVQTDPAVQLRRYVFAGGADSGGRSRALFEKDGAVTALAPGEDLEGFILVKFDAAGAEFERDGVVAMVSSLPDRHQDDD